MPITHPGNNLHPKATPASRARKAEAKKNATKRCACGTALIRFRNPGQERWLAVCLKCGHTEEAITP